MSLWALPGWSHTQDSNQTMLSTGAPTCQRPLPVTWNLRILERFLCMGALVTHNSSVTTSLSPSASSSTFLLNTWATTVQKFLPGCTAPHVDRFDESYHPCLITTDLDPKLHNAGTTYHLLRVLSTFSNIFVDCLCCRSTPHQKKYW